MTEVQFDVVVAHFEHIGMLLTQIRDALLPPVDLETDGCSHPEGSRVDLSTLTERHWICRDCRHEERLTR